MTGASRQDGTLAGVNPRMLVKGLVLIATLAALGWALKASGLGDILDTHWVDHQIKGQGLSGDLAFLAVGSLAIAVGFPRQAVCFLAGYAFGLINGALLASLASLAGCVGCFFYARLIGRELVLHKFAARVRRVDDFLHDNPLTMTVLIRFLPVGSNLLTNLVGGVSSVRPVPFFLGSVIGYAPQTVVFVLLGSGIQVETGLRITLSVLLFVASAVLGIFLYKRLRHGHSLGPELDIEAQDPTDEAGA